MSQRSYEALFILQTIGTEQDIAKAASRLEEPIKRVGGRVGQTQNFGRRRLAYRIAKQQEGHYHLVRFSAPTDRIQELERLLRLDESVIRFLILSQDEVKPQAAARGKQEIAARRKPAPKSSSVGSEHSPIQKRPGEVVAQGAPAAQVL